MFIGGQQSHSRRLTGQPSSCPVTIVRKVGMWAWLFHLGPVLVQRCAAWLAFARRHLLFELLSRCWEVYSLLGCKCATRKQELLMLTTALILFDRPPSNRNWRTFKTTSIWLMPWFRWGAYRHVGVTYYSMRWFQKTHTHSPPRFGVLWTIKWVENCVAFDYSCVQFVVIKWYFS